jgi:prolyl-tRNA editing enzyme YbaK/EbsC (Cys-tRNA(Pro) deacylase)
MSAGWNFADPGSAKHAMDLHRNNRRAVDAAAVHGLQLEVTRFPAETRTAQDAAEAIGCPVGAIVKSLVLDSDGGPLMVLTSGANRVSYDKVAAVTGRTGVRRADAETARSAMSFPVGGVSPFGHPAPLPMLLDQDLVAFDEVWASAGTPDSVFPIAPEVLIAATGAEPADVAE